MYSRKISVDLHREMLLIAENEAEQTKGKDVAYYQNDKIHLEDFDKDVMHNDSQAGEEYIFVLKGNGFGTYLMALDGESVASDVRLGDKTSKFFHMKLDDVNSGEIREVTNREAKKIVTNAVTNPEIEPRRRQLYDQLSEIVGKKESQTLRNTKMGFDFQPNPGDKSVIRLSVANNQTLIAHVLRTKIGEDKYGEQSVKKKSEYYYMQASEEVAKNLKDKPQYLSVDTTQKNYADIKKASELDYFKAKGIIVRQENTKEVGMLY